MKVYPVVDAMRQARLGRGWTQADLARESGVSEGAIAGWEAGTVAPQIARLTPVLAALRLRLAVVPFPDHDRDSEPGAVRVKAKHFRSAGTDWRVLVHDYNGPRAMYGKAHDIKSDPEQGRLPASVMGEEARARADAPRTEHSTETLFPGTEFDELVVGRWIHLEQMDAGTWWANVCGVTLWIRASRNGIPKSISVYGPEDYAAPVEGCKYSLAWDGEEFRDRVYPPDRPEVPATNTNP